MFMLTTTHEARMSELTDSLRREASNSEKRLTSEIKALTQRNDDLAQRCSRTGTNLTTANAKIADLEAQNAELQHDAGKWRERLSRQRGYDKKRRSASKPTAKTAKAKKPARKAG